MHHCVKFKYFAAGKARKGIEINANPGIPVHSGVGMRSPKAEVSLCLRILPYRSRIKARCYNLIVYFV